ncbi:hypothetical protein GGI23_005326, partial [Coemansia sp. RSA 2559]
MNIERTRRMVNGMGASQFANIGHCLQKVTEDKLQCWVNMLQYPQAVTKTMVEGSRDPPKRGRMWWPYIASRLYKHGVNIREPLGRGKVETALAAGLLRMPNEDFQLGTSQPNARSFSHISDLFGLDREGLVRVLVAGGNAWTRKVANDVKCQQDVRRGQPENPLVDINYVKTVLGAMEGCSECPDFDETRYRNPGIWNHQANAMQHWIRPAHLPAGTAALDFTREVLTRKFITAADEQALQRAELVVIHTDGSLINDEEAGILLMSFAVILNCRMREQPSANAQTMDSTEPDKILLSGRTMDGPFSSMNGELMVIAAALAV